jgi:hypothetical protein
MEELNKHWLLEQLNICFRGKEVLIFPPAY